MNVHIPTKMTSMRLNQPWCNRQVKRQAEEEGLQESKKVQAPNKLDQIQEDTERPPGCMQKCQEFICTSHVSGTGSNNKKLY